jgi:hypothetical protein
MSLMVVDHPDGTEVFVDERFAVPPPKLAVVTTGPVQPMASVHDDQGHDVSELASARDNRFIDFAGRGEYQGITRRHFVELELPESAPRSGPLWLIAQGWVHPTDSSINVAISQGAHAAPEGLSLEVADATRPLRARPDGPRLPVRQRQNGAHRPFEDRCRTPPASRHQSRDLLGSPGLGHRPS